MWLGPLAGGWWLAAGLLACGCRLVKFLGCCDIGGSAAACLRKLVTLGDHDTSPCYRSRHHRRRVIPLRRPVFFTTCLLPCPPLGPGAEGRPPGQVGWTREGSGSLGWAQTRLGSDSNSDSLAPPGNGSRRRRRRRRRSVGAAAAARTVACRPRCMLNITISVDCGPAPRPGASGVNRRAGRTPRCQFPSWFSCRPERRRRGRSATSAAGFSFAAWNWKVAFLDVLQPE